MLIRLAPDRPLGDQLYARVREAILSGELRPGDRLPPTRRLAADLGVGRNTVVGAWQRLEAEGYLEARRGAGTRVAREIPREELRRAGAGRPAAAPGAGPPGRLSAEGRRVVRHGHVFAPLTLADPAPLAVDFAYNTSVADPASRRAWQRVVRRVSAEHERRPPPFDARRRPGRFHAAILRHLRLARGVVGEPEQLMPVASPQQAFRIALRLLVDPGEGVAVEDPHYLGIRNAVRAMGARIEPVPSDEAGPRPVALPDRPDVRVAYVAPSHQWPTGAVQPLARRLSLLDWARRRRGWILENDHNAERFHPAAPVESLQGLDGGRRVVHVGTFSRVLAPMPSVAYAVVPAALVDAFRKALWLEGYAPSASELESLARFVEDGELDRLVRRAARRLRDGRERLLEALDRLPGRPLAATPRPGGLHVHVVVRGAGPAAVDQIVAEARAAGVGVYPDAPFFLRPPREAGLLLGFAGLGPAAIDAGIARLGEVLARERPGPTPGAS